MTASTGGRALVPASHLARAPAEGALVTSQGRLTPNTSRPGLGIELKKDAERFAL